MPVRDHVMLCPTCKTEIATTDKIGFREECPKCHADLHVCVACHFYDPSVYNGCRETQADRVLTKDRANFCDYFKPGEYKAASNPADDAKKKLEELFRKK